MIKTFILDTNILVQTNGSILNGLDNNKIIIFTSCLEELDNLKKAPKELGQSARDAIRTINKIFDGANSNIAELKNGGSVELRADVLKFPTSIPKSWSRDKVDNIILASTKSMVLNNTTQSPIILITNDVAMTLKAKAIGLIVQEYKNEIVINDETEEYEGRRFIICKSEIVNKLYKKGYLDLDEIDESFEENEFITFQDETNLSHCVLGWRRGYQIKLINFSEKNKRIAGIIPKNSGQSFALAALTDPEIDLVILKGQAGSGKTFLAMAAGVDGVYDSNESKLYDSVLITRSNTLSDNDIGYLPGTLEEKMNPLVAPFYDNLKVILKGQTNEDIDQINIQIEDMTSSGIIEIMSLAYIRGRSISHSYIIVDECQNLTQEQVNTIVTRAGEGTKLVMMGDIDQIDSPNLTKRNNGLSYLSQKMKGSPLVAQLSFDKEKECLRSRLAAEAISRLVKNE